MSDLFNNENNSFNSDNNGYNNNDYNFNNYNSNGYDPNTVSGADAVPKKKKGLKIAAISAGAVVALGGGGVAAYNMSDYVKNQVKMSTLEPDEYCAWVIEENAATAAKSAAEAYDESLAIAKDGQKASMELKYKASDEAKEMLLDYLGEGADESNEGYQKLVDIINDNKSIAIGMDVSAKKNQTMASVYAALNDSKLLSVDAAVDAEALSIYARIPELTEKWLGIEGEALVDSSELDEYQDTYNELLADPEKLLSAAELEKLINRYAGVLADSFNDADLKKNIEISAGDAKVEYNVIILEVDEKTAYKLVDNFLDTAADDKIVKEMLCEDLEVCTEKEYDEFFEEAMAELEEESEDLNSDEKIEIELYVDDKGVIRGFSAIMEDEFSVNTIIGKEDDKVGGQFYFSAEGETLSVTLDADEKKDVYNGELIVDYSGSEGDVTASVEFDDFEIMNEEKGYVNGDFKIILPEIDPVAFSLESDGKSQEISYEIVIDDKNFGKISLEMSSDDSAKVNMPSSDDAVIIDPSGSFDIQSYVTAEDIDKFALDLLVKFGFSEEEVKPLIEGLGESIMSEASGSMGDEYYYEDEYYDEYYDDEYYDFY